MILEKSSRGYFTARVNHTEIVLFLTEDLLPSDDSLSRLEYMARFF